MTVRRGIQIWEWHGLILRRLMDGSSEKIPSKDMENFFPDSQICHNQFLYLKTQPMGLGNCRVPIFCGTGFRCFAVCSLVPRINFLPYTTELFKPKKSKLLEKANLKADFA